MVSAISWCTEFGSKERAALNMPSASSPRPSCVKCMPYSRAARALSPSSSACPKLDSAATRPRSSQLDTVASAVCASADCGSTCSARKAAGRRRIEAFVPDDQAAAVAELDRYVEARTGAAHRAPQHGVDAELAGGQ